MYIPVALPLSLYVHMHVFIFVQLFWEIELLCYYHYMLSWIYIILYPWQQFTVEGLLLKNSDCEKCDWERRTALVGKIMSCVIRAYSLIHYSFTRQLTLDKSVVLILYNGCDLANKYFMWKNPVIPSCKKIIKMSIFFHVQFCCQLKGFILNIDVDFLYIEISSISQIELKYEMYFFIIKKALHDPLKGNDWKGER